MRPWKDEEYVYFIMNINGNHWVMCEVALSAWMVTIYDSDFSLNTDKAIGTTLLPIIKLLPNLLLTSGAFTNHPYMEDEKPHSLKDFSLQRLGSDIVPQSKRR